MTFGASLDHQKMDRYIRKLMMHSGGFISTRTNTLQINKNLYTDVVYEQYSLYDAFKSRIVFRYR